MKHILAILLALCLIFASSGLNFAPFSGVQSAQAYTGIPTFSIVEVVADKSVTIKTHNFPAGDSFRVLMNDMGTKGINGIKVANISSGAGGSFTAKFSIPPALKGDYRIAIRLESTSGSGYYAYNWFYNNTSTASQYKNSKGYYGYPTMSITRVVRNKNVSVKIYNLPKNDQFKVLMGPIGTKGIGGTKVTSFSTGAGGNQTYKFKIPDSLVGKKLIAIRIQSTSGSGYYAYNWFYNSTYP